MQCKQTKQINNVRDMSCDTEEFDKKLENVSKIPHLKIMNWFCSMNIIMLFYFLVESNGKEFFCTDLCIFESEGIEDITATRCFT